MIESHSDHAPPCIGEFTLEELRLVDAEPLPAFDALTRLAIRLLDVPVALISIVQEEEDRQFFASQQGLQEPWASRRQTPLSHSFCQHVKRRNEPLVVPDARQHELVCNNPAIQELDVAAYLGVPIADAAGAPIGALCVIDTDERDWTESDLDVLNDLARCANDEILLRASLATNAATHERTKRYNALRESVTLAFAAPDLPMDERFRELLRAGCSALGLETGLIAKLQGNGAEILFAHRGASDAGAAGRPILPGSLAELVVQGQQQFYFHDVEHSNACDRRTLDGQCPGCYVGMPLIFDGVLHGVLEMSSSVARKTRWSEEELSVLAIVSMFTCANLGVCGQLKTLRKSEAALLQYLIETKHGDSYHVSGLSKR